MSYLKRGAGALTHRVKIQERIENDTDGAADPHYELVQEVWASIEGLAGRENFTSQQVQSTSDHLIRTRYHGFIQPKHRFCYYDPRRERYRFFNITASIDPDGSGTYLDHYVKEWTEAPQDAEEASA